jgi:hypothetical protein
MSTTEDRDLQLGRENDELRETVVAQHQALEVLQAALRVLQTDVPRPDGKPRMTNAQRDALWLLCGRYNVTFREDDYLLIPRESSFTPGFVEGWVGGSLHAAGRPRSTIYVGVEPDGRSHS